jgi:hypothetical protein
MMDERPETPAGPSQEAIPTTHGDPPEDLVFEFAYPSSTIASRPEKPRRPWLTIFAVITLIAGVAILSIPGK